MQNCQLEISTLQSSTLTLVSTRAVAAIMETIFGYTLIERNDNCCKFLSAAGTDAEIINLIEARGDSISSLSRSGNLPSAFILSNKIFSLSIHVTQLGEVYFEYAPNVQSSFVPHKKRRTHKSP